MNTKVLENYIQITNEAIKWIIMFPTNIFPIVPFCVDRGRELMNMLAKWDINNLKEEIFSNSSIDNLNEWVQFYKDRLENEGVNQLLHMGEFDLSDMSLNPENKYHDKICRSVKSGFLPQDIADDIPSIVYNIATYINKNTNSITQCLQDLCSVPKKNKEAGNVKATFSSIIQYEDKDKLLNRLHYLIDGKKGANVGCVLLKAQIDGYLINIPTQKQFISEFQLIGTWESVRKYMSDNNQKALEKANKIIIFD